jgi:hypothetical protein
VVEQTHRRQSSVKSWRYTGRGCGGRAQGASWHRGEAEAGLGRGWGAAERRVHGGAGGAAQQSKVGDGVGAQWRLQCGVTEPEEVRGG